MGFALFDSWVFGGFMGYHFGFVWLVFCVSFGLDVALVVLGWVSIGVCLGFTVFPTLGFLSSGILLRLHCWYVVSCFWF